MKFGQWPCTIVQGLWPDFGATLKIRKKSNCDRYKMDINCNSMLKIEKKLLENYF